MPIVKVAGQSRVILREARGIWLPAKIWEALERIAGQEKLTVNYLLRQGAEAMVQAYRKSSE